MNLWFLIHFSPFRSTPGVCEQERWHPVTDSATNRLNPKGGGGEVHRQKIPEQCAHLSPKSFKAIRENISTLNINKRKT